MEHPIAKSPSNHTVRILTRKQPFGQHPVIYGAQTVYLALYRKTGLAPRILQSSADTDKTIQTHSTLGASKEIKEIIIDRLCRSGLREGMRKKGRWFGA